MLCAVLITSTTAIYRLKAHSTTAEAVVFCLRPHKPIPPQPSIPLLLKRDIGEIVGGKHPRLPGVHLQATRLVVREKLGYN